MLGVVPEDDKGERQQPKLLGLQDCWCAMCRRVVMTFVYSGQLQGPSLENFPSKFMHGGGGGGTRMTVSRPRGFRRPDGGQHVMQPSRGRCCLLMFWHRSVRCLAACSENDSGQRTVAVFCRGTTCESSRNHSIAYPMTPSPRKPSIPHSRGCKVEEAISWLVGDPQCLGWSVQGGSGWCLTFWTSQPSSTTRAFILRAALT